MTRSRNTQSVTMNIKTRKFVISETHSFGGTDGVHDVSLGFVKETLDSIVSLVHFKKIWVAQFLKIKKL